MNKNVKYLVYPYLLMWIVIFVLPYFSLDNYSIIKNTTSHLGAQSTPNAWIMNVVFILLGAGSIYSGWSMLKYFWVQRTLLLIFGLSLISAAFFRHAPIDPTLPYIPRYDELHSIFASITGFSFTLFAISTAFVLKTKTQKICAAGIAILAMSLSILMFTVGDYMGVWQRMIFICSFGWMIYIFKTENHFVS
ncbi:MAG: DUF998 domain-containing protein [Crocinitomicaceae bacterium]|nr:DUF998 domain-containing protein [Crocinitomicaceae bacterium]